MTAKRQKARAPGGAARRSTIPLYVRIPTKLHTELVAIVKSRGWPHTIASVAGELLEVGLTDLVNGGPS